MQRFKQKNGHVEKIKTTVSFPLKLDMLPYTYQARSQDTRENFALARSCTYDLQSVVVHDGSLDTGKLTSPFSSHLADVLGHYKSYSRVGNQWFVFNDHKVNLASKSDVLKSEAYLLFYVIQSLA